MKCFFRVLGLLSCVVFPSCTSLKWVTMERLAPAELDFPVQTNRVLVLSTQAVREEQMQKSDSEFYLDSKSIADSLAQFLADAAYFEEVVVSDTVLLDNAMSPYGENELRPSVVSWLCDIYGVDLLLTVDQALFVPLGFDYPFMKGQLEIGVRCYKKNEVAPVATIIEKTNLAWGSWARLKYEGTRTAASLVLPSIVPQWQTEDFPYYTGANIGQRDAAVYVREGNWDGAASLWRSQLTHKNRRRRMEAHLNMAVYHELKDDSIGTAHVYALKALELSQKGMEVKDGSPVNPTNDYLLISDYIKDMERRGRNLEKVKKQMQRFSNDF